MSVVCRAVVGMIARNLHPRWARASTRAKGHPATRTETDSGAMPEHPRAAHRMHVRNVLRFPMIRPIRVVVSLRTKVRE